MQETSPDRHSYNLGLIGNCAYLALIQPDTAVAWRCWPRFDSSFVCGSLLNTERGGTFALLPEVRAEYPTVRRLGLSWTAPS